MIWFGNFTHRLPCQRCHLSNICFFQNERTYLLIRHVFTRHYYVGNKILVIKEHVFRKYPINSLIFHCLTCNSVCAFGVLLSAKNVCAMDLHKKFSEIRPEQSYSVSEAARFLGIHRCTIYDYITHTERPLPFFRMQGNLKIQFRGNDLIAYKTAGLPKKGRKRR